MKGLYIGVVAGVTMWGCFATVVKLLIDPGMSWLWAVVPFMVSAVMVLLPLSVLIHRSWKYAYIEHKLNEARKKDRENAIAEVERRYKNESL